MDLPRDDQIKLLVAAVSQDSTAQMEHKLAAVQVLLSSWPNELVANGDQLRLAGERAKQSRQTIDPFAPAP